jgi:hypothetical protein
MSRLEKRAWELFVENPDWAMTKALAAAIAEDYRKQKVKKLGKPSVRQIGWLEYT